MCKIPYNMKGCDNMESIQEYMNYWERRKHKKWVDDLFINYCQHLKNLKKKEISKTWDLQHVIPFLNYLEQNNLKKITVKNVYDYIRPVRQAFSQDSYYKYYT